MVSIVAIIETAENEAVLLAETDGWVILGLGIGPLGFIFLWQIPQVLTSVALVPEEVILLISALTPLAFAISIVRYHILDIDIIFNRSTVIPCKIVLSLSRPITVTRKLPSQKFK